MNIILSIVFLYFIFHGEPDIFDMVHKKVMSELVKVN